MMKILKRTLKAFNKGWIWYVTQYSRLYMPPII